MMPQTSPVSRMISRALLFLACGTMFAAGLDPSAIHTTLPKDIKWTDNGKSATAILAGDPNKPGIYVE